MCTPADKPLSDQLNVHEKKFLILFSEYILSSLESPLSASEPATVLSDILMTARHRLSLLSKEVSLSPHYVVIVALLQLLANLFAADNMKYPSVESFLEVYPVFQDRGSIEKEKLFHTANWMHILFQITTAKKNKGLVMEIIPKFVGKRNIRIGCQLFNYLLLLFHVYSFDQREMVPNMSPAVARHSRPRTESRCTRWRAR